MKQINLFGGEDEIEFVSVKKGIPTPVTLQEMYEFARSKAKELWNREFDIEIVISKKAKWKSRLGCYRFSKQSLFKPFIMFSEQRNQYLSREVIFDTLLHEMVHWHLHTSGLPFHDDDEEFVKELIRVGASPSGTKKAQKVFNRVKETQ